MAEVWTIEKYARYLATTGTLAKGQWQFDDSDGDLVLTLTEANYLILCQKSTVMESHSLVNAHAWMRGMTKKDSMLVMYKIKNETRRFRLKFYPGQDKTAEEECSRCADKLSSLFPIKLSSTRTRPANDDVNDRLTESNLECTPPPREEVLRGDVTIGKMAQVVSGDVKAKLPVAYHQCHIDTPELDTLIRLCLTDPSFPAYVQQVDQHLQELISECTQ